MILRNSLFLAFVILSLGACQRRIERLQGSTSSGIRFDASVPADQQELLADDFAFIETINMTGATAQDMQILGLSDLSGRSFMNWIRQGVSYIVGESFEYEQHWSVSDIAVNYPPSGPTSTNPYSGYSRMALIGLFDSHSDTSATAGEAVTIMSNFLGTVYKRGKAAGVLVNMNMAGQTVPVVSPRTGGLKVGPGLFNTYKVKNTPPTSKANRLARAVVLGHEIIHSDGRKDDVTLGHALCQQGNWKGSSANPNSSLNNEYACEKYTNGPYMVDAVLSKLAPSACTGCSNSELTFFQTMRADALSRGLSQGMRAADRTPEYVTQ